MKGEERLQHRRHDSATNHEPSLDTELLAQARHAACDTADEDPHRLAVEVTIHAGDVAAARELRQRQLDAIIRLLRHAANLRSLG